MDPWKELSAWEIGRDEVREWAAREGKSAAMSEDLHRCHVDRVAEGQGLSTLSFCAHVGVWFVEAWRLFCGR